jgi:hypothetical protein
LRAENSRAFPCWKKHPAMPFRSAIGEKPDSIPDRPRSRSSRCDKEPCCSVPVASR